MICETKHIPYKYGDTIRVKPLSDVHLGNRWCDLKAFRRYIEDVDDKTYFIGVGDLLDMVIVKDAKRYKKSSDGSPGDEDAVIDYQRDVMFEILKPVRERILCLGIGNHEAAIVKHGSTNPVKTLCTMLNVPYGGYTYFMRVVFSENGGRGRTVDFRVHHGWGGGSRTEGADITKYTRDTGKYDADVFLYGHTHKLQHYSVPVIGTNGKKLVARDRYIVICGTWLKTLSDTTDATYSEEAGFPPIKVGSPIIHIKPVDTGTKITVTT